LGQTATIVFFARFNGAQTNVVNEASVAWTSLSIDPGPGGVPIRLSIYNSTSTERRYDPLDTVNVYRVSDSVAINALGNGGGNAQGVILPKQLPFTGFAPGKITILEKQPAEKDYLATDVWMEIPSLGVNVPIVGIPLVDNAWDLSWLDKQIGWLNGTAFPGWDGNSALTGHVYLPNGKPGPFVALGTLKWGSKIIVHAYGSVYTYEVRETRTISPDNTSILKHEEKPWLTLITCKTYNESTNTYANRIAVRAALVSVQKEELGNTPKGGR
jgi:LPXTG-site transpeptidase (sortase) family protein